MLQVSNQMFQVKLDTAVHSLYMCLQHLAQPLTPEGLDEMIHPQMYVTVIAYTGLLGQPHKPVEVLVQGMIVNQSNVGDITSSLVQQIHRLENKLAQASGGSTTPRLWPCSVPPLTKISV